MNATEQTVDIVGDTAVIHGANTLTESGNVLARETLHRCVRQAERNLDGTVCAGDRDLTVTSSAIRASTRVLISSRIGRTASTPLPAGSSSAQSR